MTINFQPLLLRPRVAAQRLGISIELLRAEAERGAIEQIRVGRYFYFRPEALLAYVESLAEDAHNHKATAGTTAKRAGRMSAGDKTLSAAQLGELAIAARKRQRLAAKRTRN
jgi:hypothetical protein